MDVPDREADQSGGQVAEGDAGEYTVEAQVRPVEVGKGGEKHLDGEEDGCTPQDVQRQSTLRRAAGDARLQREHDGRAHRDLERRGLLRAAVVYLE